MQTPEIAKTARAKAMQVVDSLIKIEDYMQAENIATMQESEYGTIGDLRMQRDEVIKCANDLAEQIARLDRDVQALLTKEQRFGDLFRELGLRQPEFPTVQFNASAHGHLITERFPCDDENIDRAA